MKKLSILIALILCVTIGGVYATWNYAQGAAQSTTKYFDAGTTITDKVVSNAKGTITVDTSAMTVTIDDSDNDHYGELTLAGQVTITFTPATGADAAVSQNGIALQYSLGTTTNYNYGANPIFAVTSTAQILNSGNAAKTFTIPASELEPLISLNELYLPTLNDYQAFKEALHSGSISITVSEYTPAP